MMKINNRLALYIHIPFCKSKCKYCDFLSFNSNTETVKLYFKNLRREILLYAKEYKDYTVETIFIGGGTPSYVEAEYIEEILLSIYDNFKVADNAEISIESNPNSLTLEKATIYKNSGINRVSIGAQSFSDEILNRIGRIHCQEQIIEAVNNALQAGLSNINIDLMLGLPGQNIEDVENTFIKLKTLDIKHISYYSLILEEGTILYDEVLSNKTFLPREDVDRKMYHKVVTELENLGFKQYEISNFAKNGYECKHNLKYWTLENYLGFGLGAHSNIGNERYWNVNSTNSYNNLLQKNCKPIKDRENLSTRDRINEYFIMGLRLNAGIDLKKASLLFNKDLKSYYEREISKNIETGLLRLKDNRIYLSRKGRDLCNLVELDFMR